MFDVRLDNDFDIRIGARPGRRILYSSKGDLTPPLEPTTTCLGQWSVRPVDVDKYVDDNLQEEAYSVENVVLCPLGIKNKHVIASQNVFRHIVRAAESKGMKVNTKKASMICISDSQNYEVRSHIFDSDGVRVDSGDKMKLLG